MVYENDDWSGWWRREDNPRWTRLTAQPPVGWLLQRMTWEWHQMTAGAKDECSECCRKWLMQRKASPAKDCCSGRWLSGGWEHGKDDAATLTNDCTRSGRLRAAPSSIFPLGCRFRPRRRAAGVPGATIRRPGPGSFPRTARNSARNKREK